MTREDGSRRQVKILTMGCDRAIDPDYIAKYKVHDPVNAIKVTVKYMSKDCGEAWKFNFHQQGSVLLKHFLEFHPRDDGQMFVLINCIAMKDPDHDNRFIIIQEIILIFCDMSKAT